MSSSSPRVTRWAGRWARAGLLPGLTLGCRARAGLSISVSSNEMSLYLPEGVHVVEFADDTQLLVCGKKSDLSQIIERAERAVECLYEWFCTNRMKLNAGKTQVLVLGTPAMIRGLPPVTINVMGAVIPDSRVVKNLCVVMDST